jgi:phage host-nuclease inhibitor protein Gam
MSISEALAILETAAGESDAGVFQARAVAAVKARLAEQDELLATVLDLCDAYDDELSDDVGEDGVAELLIDDIRGALGVTT